MSILLAVETNFIVGYMLEQGADFQYLNSLVDIHPLTIAVPEFCVNEARTTLQKGFAKRRRQLNVAQATLREIGRSQFARTLVDDARNILEQLASLLEGREATLDETLNLQVASYRVIPHSPKVFIRGRMRHIGSRPPFKETDCEIYESVLAFLRAEAGNYAHAIFLNLDQEHFDNDKIRNELAVLGVELLFTVGECIAMVRRALGM